MKTIYVYEDELYPFYGLNTGAEKHYTPYGKPCEVSDEEYERIMSVMAAFEQSQQELAEMFVRKGATPSLGW